VAFGLHRGDQFQPAGGERDALFDHFVYHLDRQALQERDSFPESRLEGDLAVHGACGDQRHLVLEADFGGEFVNAFLADHGGIHVGDQELLAPRVGILHGDVDLLIADQRAKLRFSGTFVRPVLQHDVAGDSVGEPVEAGCLEAFGGALGKRGLKDGI